MRGCHPQGLSLGAHHCVRCRGLGLQNPYEGGDSDSTSIPAHHPRGCESGHGCRGQPQCWAGRSGELGGWPQGWAVPQLPGLGRPVHQERQHFLGEVSCVLPACCLPGPAGLPALPGGRAVPCRATPGCFDPAPTAEARSWRWAGESRNRKVQRAGSWGGQGTRACRELGRA